MVAYDRIGSVDNLCFSPYLLYTVTEKYDRNTDPGLRAKHGRIWSVFGMYTVVYGTVDDRLQTYMEFVFVDLENASDNNLTEFTLCEGEGECDSCSMLTLSLTLSPST